MSRKKYLMESRIEARRLDLKTGFEELEIQALWAGLQPGMRVLDLGCGSGKTTRFLGDLVGREGKVLGIDASEERVAYAREHYSGANLEYRRCDFFQPMEDLGTFDFIWVRFVLEYHKLHGFDLVSSFTPLLKQDGILCLVDLDHNSLSHFDLDPRLERAIYGCAKALEEKANFDPYCGRKLYSFLYDLNYREIDVRLDAHHLIYGELDSVDEFNWITKIAVAGRDSGFPFEEYEGGFEEFFEECKKFFSDPRRFTYTPVISCRGINPNR